MGLIQSITIELDFSTALDHIVELCNGVVTKLVTSILNEERDSFEA
jgi:predicted DNA-binding ribbon-helix-helix protein